MDNIDIKFLKINEILSKNDRVVLDLINEGINKVHTILLVLPKVVYDLKFHNCMVRISGQRKSKYDFVITIKQIGGNK